MKQQQLTALEQKIIDDNVCPELSGQALQLVFGEGSVDADVVFIGEAPGKKEDEQGRPFVGASGRLLGEMLQTVNLNREDVYITNIVKYRPPNNRDPLPAEKKSFMKYLQAQLDIIQAKLVVTLGRHSMNCFLPDLQIGKVHGQLQRANGMAIMPLYHPAAALYNGSMRQTLLDDFTKIPNILKKLN